MILTGVRLRLATKKLRFLPGREIPFVNSAPIHKIGIILDTFDEGLKAQFAALADYLDLKADDVFFLYCPGSEIGDYGEEKIIFRYRDIGWSGGILNPRVATFLKEDLDLLICFTREGNRLATFLTTACGAGLKVGRQVETGCDLRISTSISESGIFISELKKYLRIINKTA